MCGTELIVKQYSDKASHFAHKSKRDCDSFSHDMSEWHLNWQRLFSKDCQEVVIELEMCEREYYKMLFECGVYKDDEERNEAFFYWYGTWCSPLKDGKTFHIRHRADVCIGEYVIEFQHSYISAREFNLRNWFYNSAGYTVIWVFDFRDEWETGEIEYINEIQGRWYATSMYAWKKWRKTFIDFNPKDYEYVKVLFQFWDPEDFDYEHCKDMYMGKLSWCVPPDNNHYHCNYKRFTLNEWPANYIKLVDVIKRNKL